MDSLLSMNLMGGMARHFFGHSMSWGELVKLHQSLHKNPLIPYPQRRCIRDSVGPSPPSVQPPLLHRLLTASTLFERLPLPPSTFSFMCIYHHWFIPSMYCVCNAIFQPFPLTAVVEENWSPAISCLLLLLLFFWGGGAKRCLINSCVLDSPVRCLLLQH